MADASKQPPDPLDDCINLMHSDQLGSVSVVTSNTGVELSSQGGALGTVGAVQNHKLTVDFHEPGFVEGVQEENRVTLEKGFWFQLSSRDKQKVNDPWGPANPQALNRYAYVLNNPVRYTDPTGHILVTMHLTGIRVALSNSEVKAILNFLEKWWVQGMTAAAIQQGLSKAFPSLPWFVAAAIALMVVQTNLDWLRGIVEQGLHLEVWQYSLVSHGMPMICGGIGAANQWASHCQVNIFAAHGKEPPIDWWNVRQAYVRMPMPNIEFPTAPRQSCPGYPTVPCTERDYHNRKPNEPCYNKC